MVSEKVYTWVGRGVTSWDGYYDAMDGFFSSSLLGYTNLALGYAYRGT